MSIRLWRTYVRAGALKERALRRLMPSRMNFVHYSWPLRPAVCPCDIHFCEYLVKRNVRGKRIFHLGTGGHHLVGSHNLDLELGNEVLGLTISPSELSKYVARVIRTPRLGLQYKVLFADLYTLSAANVPRVDIASLFHLGEFAPLPDGGTAPRSDEDVLRLFCERVSPGGIILFYRGSFGYARCAPLIGRAVAERALEFVESYHSLEVYRIAPTGVTRVHVG